MSTTTTQADQNPSLSPSGKFVRKWAAILSWVAAAVLVIVIAVFASDKLEGAISTALAIFSFGIFAATIQSARNFYIGFGVIFGGLIVAFIATLGTVPIAWTVANAVITVVSVCLTTFGSPTHLTKTSS